MHRFEITTHGGGHTSIGAASELEAVLMYCRQKAETWEEYGRPGGRLGRPAWPDAARHWPVAVEHARVCACRQMVKEAESLYA